MTAPEPSFTFQFIGIWIIPYLVYFFGIYIRKTVFPSSESPSWLKQMLGGVAIALLTVSPFIVVLHESISAHFPAYLFFLGVIMEHSMMLHEEAIKRLEKRSS